MNLVKPPKGQRLPDIVTVEEARQPIEATRMLSYRMFFFTLYSLGRRLGEGLALRVADSDAARRHVHIRASKGKKDRFVPLGDDAGPRPVRSRRSRTRSRVWRRASCPPSRFRAIRAK